MNCSLPGFSVHGDSPGRNTGVGCHALLQGIFPTQGSNPGLCIASKFFTIWGTREARVKWETLWTELPGQGSREGAGAQSNEETGPRRFQRLICNGARECQGDKGRTPADPDYTGHLWGRGRRQGLPSARFPFHGPLRGASQVIPGKVRVAERREKERKRVKIEYCPAVQA